MWGRDLEDGLICPSSKLPPCHILILAHSLSLRGSDAENSYSFLCDCGPSLHVSSSYLAYVGVQLKLVDCWGFAECASYCQKGSAGAYPSNSALPSNQVTLTLRVHRTLTGNPASCQVPSHARSHSVLVISLWRVPRGRQCLFGRWTTWRQIYTTRKGQRQDPSQMNRLRVRDSRHWATRKAYFSPWLGMTAIS